MDSDTYCKSQRIWGRSLSVFESIGLVCKAYATASTALGLVGRNIHYKQTDVILKLEHVEYCTVAYASPDYTKIEKADWKTTTKIY